VIEGVLWKRRLSKRRPPPLRKPGGRLEKVVKRIVELEENLEGDQRAARRPSAPFRVRARKSPPAPKRHTRKCGHPGTFRHKPDDFHASMSPVSRGEPGVKENRTYQKVISKRLPSWLTSNS
jgi:hypothetical protein